MAKPTVSLLMAMSADGFITKHTDGFVDWTSKEDKKHFVAMTKEAGVLIYGRKTFALHNRALPGRLNVVMTRNPDEYKSIPDSLEFTNQEPVDLIEDLSHRGFKHIMVTGGPEINDLFLRANLIDDLYLTIEPRLFGSGKHLLPPTSYDVSLELVETTPLNKDSLLLHYRIKR